MFAQPLITELSYSPTTPFTKMKENAPPKRSIPPQAACLEYIVDRRSAMTLCPVAIVAGCKKCPAFAFCPLKCVIGDYQGPEPTQTKQRTEKTNTDTKQEK